MPPVFHVGLGHHLLVRLPTTNGSLPSFSTPKPPVRSRRMAEPSGRSRVADTRSYPASRYAEVRAYFDQSGSYPHELK